MSDEKRPAGAQQWIDAQDAWDEQRPDAPVEERARLAADVEQGRTARMIEVRGLPLK